MVGFVTFFKELFVEVWLLIHTVALNECRNFQDSFWNGRQRVVRDSGAIFDKGQELVLPSMKGDIGEVNFMAVDSENMIERTEAQAVPESFIAAVVADVIFGNGPDFS